MNVLHWHRCTLCELWELRKRRGRCTGCGAGFMVATPRPELGALQAQGLNMDGLREKGTDQ